MKDFLEVALAILMRLVTLLLALVVAITPYCVLIVCIALCVKWVLESLL